MADFQDQTTIVVDDERPLSVRRKRRNGSIGSNTLSRSNSYSRSTASLSFGISTPPQTPKRAKKRVRFSEPGPEIQDASSPSSSSGLTPFIRRTTLATPASKRRHSPPATLWNRAEYDFTPISGTLQFAPLRQVLDGRVKRRIRRNRLSEELNTIHMDKTHEAKERKSEVERLREELAAKDLEVQRMRVEQEIASQIEEESGISLSTNTILSTKVQELEQEIRDLKAELQRKESFETQDTDWNLAGRDPFNFDEEDDNIITNYDEDFRESMMNDEMITTPTRLNASFPSPPSTIPNTPCKLVASMNVGIQTSLPISDPENEALKSQLESLQFEISKLTSAIAFKDDHQSRLLEKLSEFISTDECHDHTTMDSALDKVLTELVLSQSHVVERNHAFSALTTEISILGFTSSGPEESLEIIANQFRQARLDLEYLAPGEVVEGFENEKLLEMLISRIRVLVGKVKEQDNSIDQYHEQELLLRQQLNSRVTAMDSMKQELFLANSVVGDLRGEVQEKGTSNERLQTALEGYREEVKGLENLIQRMEKEGHNTEGQLRSEIQEAEERLQDEVLKHDTTRADNEGKEVMLMELERRLNAALQSASEVQAQLYTLSTTVTEKDAKISKLQRSNQEREKAHGNALALRDARVSELREEIERVNNALKTAHSTILTLKTQNRDLEAQVEGEKTRGQFVVQAMRDQLNRALETGMGYVNGDISVQGPSLGNRGSSAPPENLGMGGEQVVVRRGRFLDGDLARKGGKKRRRYDSGLGFLGEEDEDVIDLGMEVEEAVERVVNHF